MIAMPIKKRCELPRHKTVQGVGFEIDDGRD